MLSFGVRFGQGFDKSTLLKLMQSITLESDYDLLVIGSSPGGIACAREAVLADKKTAIIKWRNLSTAEEQGYDEDLDSLAENLRDDLTSLGRQSRAENASESSLLKLTKKMKESVSSKTFVGSKPSSKSSNKSIWTKKVRQNRLDLRNELFKRGQQGRKLMINTATLQDTIQNAKKFGWRIPAFLESLTINWNKMTEKVMDFCMKENWDLKCSLEEEGVDIIEGKPFFINNNTIKIFQPEETLITANIICLAPPSEYILPVNVKNASVYGITCDDFIRLTEPPGTTLVVGATPEGLECAGIAACCLMPVTVVCRSRVLKGYDSQICGMLVEDLTSRGVEFLQNTELKSLSLNNEKKIMAEFFSVPQWNEKTAVTLQRVYDTVVFAVGRKVHLADFNLPSVGIQLNTNGNKITTNEDDQTLVPNIYAVGDIVDNQPQSPEISETVGKLLGKRLFGKGEEKMDYSMIPYVIFTPVEYAFCGLSEDGALFRFGAECTEVYLQFFSSLKFATSTKEIHCLVKVVIFKPKDMVVGMHMLGPDAGEVIQAFAVALKTGLTIKQLQNIVGVPTTSAQKIIRLGNERDARKEIAN